MFKKYRSKWWQLPKVLDKKIHANMCMFFLRGSCVAPLDLYWDTPKDWKLSSNLTCYVVLMSLIKLRNKFYKYHI